MLDRRETISIPGFGSLVLENLSAKLRTEPSEITPPQVNLSYYNTQTTSSALLRYLAGKYNITTDQAKLAYSKFTERFLNNLLNYGEVQIRGVANITRKDGHILVKPLDSFISRYYKNLNPLGLTKLKGNKKIKKKEKGDKQNDDKIGKNLTKLESADQLNVIESPDEKGENSEKALIKEKALNPIIPESSLQDNSKTSVKTIEKSVKKQNKNVFESELVKEKVSEYFDFESTPIQDDSNGSCLKWSVMALALMFLLCFGIWKGCGSGNSTVKPSVHVPLKENQSGKKSQSENLIVDSIERETIMETKSDLTKKEIVQSIPEDGICIVITGVFTSTKHIDKMKKELLSLGYRTYTEAYGPYTRVGIRFNCEGMDLEKRLESIRNKTKTKAWYLIPKD